MTTPQAAAQYLAEYQSRMGNLPLAAYNPHNKPMEELPTIYGFNNGGASDWLEGCIIAESGHCLGGHICSHEGYMPGDLGCLEGSCDDRHADFRKHYPNGYKMEFVGSASVRTHAGLRAAYERNQALPNENASQEAEAK